MHLSFDIVRQPDPITKTTWTFNLFTTTFVLDHYEEAYKLPPSTKWRIKHVYDRVLGHWNTLEAEQIKIPDDVEAELLETFISKLTVKTWK